MCQLCAINVITGSERWPKPLEQLVKDTNFLVDHAHDEHNMLNEAIGKDAPEPPISFLMTIRDIFTMVGTLEEEREKWWTSPLKRSQRREWEERSENAKLVGLHKVNNSTNSMIESVKARLGGFVKWTLGIHGGLEEVEALIAAK